MKQFMQKITGTISAALIALTALAAVLSASLANVALAASMTKAEPAVSQQQARQPGTLSIITVLFGLVQRQVAIYAPSGYQPGAALPLVVALHGGGGDASKMYDPEKRIVEYAESQGFIAVFPNGLPKPGAPVNSNNYFWGDPVNIDFMNHLINLMMNHIDSRRVYFIGFSGGAALIYTIKISFQAKVDSWRLFVAAGDGMNETLPGAPARVEAMRYTNPATGHTVISALDPELPHKWPEWNFMGVIWDFFERAPTR